MKYIQYGTEFLDQLKDSVHDLYEDNKELRELLEYKNDKIKRLKEKIKGYEQERERVLNIIEERNHKAIEYIEKHIVATETENILLEILKGEDNE